MYSVLVRVEMLIFGLTGGIATGKTVVSDMLSELSCPIIDADIIARRGKDYPSTMGL